jgi:hypothetical protein
MNNSVRMSLEAKLLVIQECHRQLGRDLEEILLQSKNLKEHNVIIVKKDGSEISVVVVSSKRQRFITNYYKNPKRFGNQNNKFVFVDIADETSPRFFVLTSSEVDKEQRIRNINSIPTGSLANPMSGNGVDNLLIDSLLKYENLWEKLLD